MEKYKYFINRTLQLAVIVGALFFYQNQLNLKAAKVHAEVKEQEAVQAKEQLVYLQEQLDQMQAELGEVSADAAAEKESGYLDGTYTGEGNGFGGTIRTEIVISDGKLTEINILDADGEDAAYLDMAKGVIPRMLEQQSASVDTISGATFSSGGIIDAVKQGLAEAVK